MKENGRKSGALLYRVDPISSGSIAEGLHRGGEGGEEGWRAVQKNKRTRAISYIRALERDLGELSRRRL